jgi:hypothetical protein
MLVLQVQAHMSVHKFREVQQRTLLSTKTGGCSENCSCCTQSSRYNTGSKAQKLMNKDAILFWPLLYLLTYMTFYDSLLTCTILSMFFVRDGALSVVKKTKQMIPYLEQVFHINTAPFLSHSISN